MNVMPRLHVKPATRGDYTPEEIAIQAGRWVAIMGHCPRGHRRASLSHHTQMRREIFKWLRKKRKVHTEALSIWNSKAAFANNACR
jgi:hypothetical protein